MRNLKLKTQSFGGSQFHGLFLAHAGHGMCLITHSALPRCQKSIFKLAHSAARTRVRHCGKHVEQTRKRCGQNWLLYTQFIQKPTTKIDSRQLIHRNVHRKSASFPLFKNSFLHLLNKHLSTLSTMPITTTMYK